MASTRFDRRTRVLKVADDELRRQELNTRLTVIHLQTELLQRQLRRRTGLAAEDRRWLEDGLASILAATRATEARVARPS